MRNPRDLQGPKWMKAILCSSLAGLLLLPAGAASLQIINATLHTAAGPVLPNACLLVRDGKLASVGGDPGPADRTLDLQGHHLFPGLIAPTTILGLQEIDAVRATRDTTEVGAFTPEVTSWVSVNPDSELIPVARANGYTHAQPIPLGGVISGRSSVISLAGWTVEDLVVERDVGLHVFWPEFTLNTTPKERYANPDDWKSPEDQARDRDRRIREIDGFFSEADAYAKARSAPGDDRAATLVPAWEAMLPVIRGEKPVFLHADEYRQTRSAVEWAARRKYRAVLAGGRDAARVATLLATHQIPVAYEHQFTLPPREEDPYDVQFTTPALLHRAGVKVAFSEGTGRFGASTVRNIPYAAAQAVAFGLPAAEALRGLTLYPAQILGIADRLGSLEPGKDATFFATDGDILDIRTQVKRLWIGGEEVPLSSRHTQLYDKFRNRPRTP